MTPLMFDTLEFARLPQHGKARVVMEGDLAVILEALTRTGNGLGKRMEVQEGRGLIMCPMEGDDD